MKRRNIALLGAAALVAMLAAACSAPSLPSGVLPTNAQVPAGQGAPPNLSPMLVPYTSMVVANPAWSKQATLPDSVAMYAPKGCAAATTNYAVLSDVPDAYEVLIGCPIAGDINVLYSQVNWTKLESAGWHPTANYGSYGKASEAFVQFYAYPGDGGDGCWTYLDMFHVNNVLGVTAYCDEVDKGITSLPQIKTAAEGWTAAVVHQITSVDAPKPKPDTL